MRFGASAEKPALLHQGSFLKPHLTPFSTLQRRPSRVRCEALAPLTVRLSATVERRSDAGSEEAESVKQISQRNDSEGGIRQGSSVTPRAAKGKSVQTGGRRKPRSARVAPPTTHNEEPGNLRTHSKADKAHSLATLYFCQHRDDSILWLWSVCSMAWVKKIPSKSTGTRPRFSGGFFAPHARARNGSPKSPRLRVQVRSSRRTFFYQNCVRSLYHSPPLVTQERCGALTTRGQYGQSNFSFCGCYSLGVIFTCYRLVDSPF